jgi:hypothetical protein
MKQKEAIKECDLVIEGKTSLFDLNFQIFGDIDPSF